MKTFNCSILIVHSSVHCLISVIDSDVVSKTFCFLYPAPTRSTIKLYVPFTMFVIDNVFHRPQWFQNRVDETLRGDGQWDSRSGCWVRHLGNNLPLVVTFQSSFPEFRATLAMTSFLKGPRIAERCGWTENGILSVFHNMVYCPMYLKQKILWKNCCKLFPKFELKVESRILFAHTNLALWGNVTFLKKGAMSYRLKGHYFCLLIL